MPAARNFLEFGLEHLLEQVLEAAVIGLEDGVLGRQVDRPAQIEPVVERGAGEIADRVVEVVHCHGDPGRGGVEHLAFDHVTVFALELDGDLAGPREAEIGGAILVSESMAADHDGSGPARNEARHVAADDRLAEDDTAQNVADRAVGAAIHPLEPEFLHPRLVGRDGGAFDGDADLFRLLGGLDGDPVIGAVAFLDPEIVVKQVDIEIGQDQLVLDEGPDDAGHLVAIHLDDGIFHFDLGHRKPLERGESLCALYRKTASSGSTVCKCIRCDSPRPDRRIFDENSPTGSVSTATTPCAPWRSAGRARFARVSRRAGYGQRS